MRQDAAGWGPRDLRVRKNREGVSAEKGRLASTGSTSTACRLCMCNRAQDGPLCAINAIPLYTPLSTSVRSSGRVSIKVTAGELAN